MNPAKYATEALLFLAVAGLQKAGFYKSLNLALLCVAVAYRTALGKEAWPLMPNPARRLNRRTLTGEDHPDMPLRKRLYRHYLDLRYLVMMPLHTFCWHLDDILFPQYKDVEVVDPVFLVGGFRTGSTSLHRMMAMDEDRYISPKIIEVGIPYMWLHYLTDMMERADERWNLGIVAKIDAGWEKTMGTEVLNRHPMAWHGAEECDMLLAAYQWCGYYAYGMSPDPEQMLVNGQITKFSQEEQDRIFNVYKKSIQKILYRRGAGRAFLSKSHLIELMPAFKERFAGSKFVGIMRDPKDTMVSWLSLCRPMTKVFNLGYTVPLPIDVDAHFKFQRLFGEAEEKFFITDRAEGDESRIHAFVFKDFIKKQEETLFKLYKAWGMEVSEKFKSALESAREEHKDYKKKHNYKNPTFAELGVDSSVDERFAHYNKVFGIN